MYIELGFTQSILNYFILALLAGSVFFFSLTLLKNEKNFLSFSKTTPIIAIGLILVFMYKFNHNNSYNSVNQLTVLSAFSKTLKNEKLNDSELNVMTMEYLAYIREKMEPEIKEYFCEKIAEIIKDNKVSYAELIYLKDEIVDSIDKYNRIKIKQKLLSSIKENCKNCKKENK